MNIDKYYVMHILKEKRIFLQNLENVTNLNVFFESCVFQSTVHQIK